MLAAALAEPGGRQALAAAADRAGLTGAARLLGDAAVPDAALAGALRQALLAEPAAAERLATGPAALRLLAGPDSYLLTPYGPAGTILHVSYHQVVNGDPDALALLRGRILFLGASDPGERVPFDTFPTAFGRPDGDRDGRGRDRGHRLPQPAERRPARLAGPARRAALLAGSSAALAALVGAGSHSPLAGSGRRARGRGADGRGGMRLLGRAHLLLPARLALARCWRSAC